MIDLKQLRALEKAATPGPWENVGEGPDTVPWVRSSNAIIKCINNVDILGIADTALIVAFRNAAPDILALLEEARELAKCVPTGSLVSLTRMASAFLVHFALADDGKE